MSLASQIAAGGSTDHIPLSDSIQQDPSIPVPVGGSSSSFDARRVVSMDSVVTVESQAGLLADLENVAVM